MRPVNLTMQAFGPFAGRAEIDFRQLGRNPLFLINGPTGAGKSSILDAICFALYGQTTGAEREGAQMRCDHSDVSVLTEVILEFELGDKRYLIRRVPQQERSKSRGEGTTVQSPEAVLKELDGSEEGRLLVSKSVSEANDRIKQLMGLGVEQFRQVMVLPQGKFRELLMADSKEREAIFSQLFETHIYKQIENRLKEKAGNISREVAAHESEIKGILQSADVSSETQLEEELTRSKEEAASAKVRKETSEAAVKLAQKAKDEADALVKRFDSLSVKQREKISKLTSASEIDSKKVHLDRSEKAQAIYHLYASQLAEASKFTALADQRKSASEALSAAREAQLSAATEKAMATEAALALDGLKQSKAELDRWEKVNHDLIHAQGVFTKAQAESQQSEAAFLQKKAVLEQLDAEMKEKVTLSDQLSRNLVPYTNMKVAHQALKQRVEEGKKRDQLRERIENGRAKVGQAEKDHQVSLSDWEKAKTHTLKTEMRWHAGQANLLARQLVDGEPCPVCGSAEHPEPARGGEEQIVSKQDVEEARSAEAQWLRALEEKRETLAKYSSHLEVLRSQLSEVESNLGTDALKTLEQISEAYHAASQNIIALESNQSQLQEITHRMHQLRVEQSESKSALSHLEAKSNEDKRLATVAHSRLAQLEEQVPAKYRVPGALHTELMGLSKQIEEIDLRLKSAEAAFQAKQSTLDSASSIEKTLSDQMRGQKILAEESRALWLKNLEESAFTDEANFVSARLDETQQHALKLAVDTYRTEMDSLNAVIKELEKELEAKHKPDLAALDSVLSDAINHFTKADDGWRGVEARVQQLSALQQKLHRTHEKSRSLAQQYAVMGTLSEVAGGTSGHKISLQRFVLSVLLEDVVIQASQRLHLMSKGRYQLVRKEDRAKGNKASGLELEVEDGYTGKTRSVATLSGGESFMAALSLALGLSDVVQSYAGGIKLDTLFIDEGFGSLDSESLDAAIQVLIDLQSSGRMIGIISHVAELKEQMALRIDVRSGSAGSFVSTVVA